MTAIADTGFMLALLVETDAQHQACAPIYQQQRIIYLPQSTLGELAYMLWREGGNAFVARFLHGLADSRVELVPLTDIDIARTAELLDQYADARLDFVDASVIAVAERLDITRILTLDRRDFALVRPRHCEYLELLP